MQKLICRYIITIPYIEGDFRQFLGKFHYYVVMPHFFPTASKKLCREL
jgi:hypothetical protein